MELHDCPRSAFPAPVNHNVIVRRGLSSRRNPRLRSARALGGRPESNRASPVSQTGVLTNWTTVAVGAGGFEPPVRAYQTRAFTAWPYPCVLLERLAGLEPAISTPARWRAANCTAVA
jgi:hypothetical protein